MHVIYALLLPFFPSFRSAILLNTYAGNQALDSGLVGIGLGALGATVLAPAGELSPFSELSLLLQATFSRLAEIVLCWKSSLFDQLAMH